VPVRFQIGNERCCRRPDGVPVVEAATSTRSRVPDTQPGRLPLPGSTDNVNQTNGRRFDAAGSKTPAVSSFDCNSQADDLRRRA